LLRFATAVERDPAIDAWFESRAGKLGAIARPWFERMRQCGDDVREFVLKQKGHFKCPNGAGARKAAVSDAVVRVVDSQAPKSSSEKAAKVIADLQKRGTARPRTLNTLTSTIRALFQKQIAEQEVSFLIERLRRDGVISVSGEKVSYHLP
jgi:hypothetical protein